MQTVEVTLFIVANRGRQRQVKAGRGRRFRVRQRYRTAGGLRGLKGRWATPGEGWRQAQGQVKQIRA